MATLSMHNSVCIESVAMRRPSQPTRILPTPPRQKSQVSWPHSQCTQNCARQTKKTAPTQIGWKRLLSENYHCTKDLNMSMISWVGSKFHFGKEHRLKLTTGKRIHNVSQKMEWKR